MAFLNRSSSRILGSQQLWNRGVQNSQPQEVSQAKSHLRTQASPCPYVWEQMGQKRLEQNGGGVRVREAEGHTAVPSVGHLHISLPASCWLFKKKEGRFRKVSPTPLH
jgi:hypothetical protein